MRGKRWEKGRSGWRAPLLDLTPFTLLLLLLLLRALPSKTPPSVFRGLSRFESAGVVVASSEIESECGKRRRGILSFLGLRRPLSLPPPRSRPADGDGGEDDGNVAAAAASLWFSPPPPLTMGCDVAAPSSSPSSYGVSAPLVLRR